MKKGRIKQLMAMPISRPVLNSVMLVKKCDELNARVFLESHYTCRNIAETVNQLVREEIIKEIQLMVTLGEIEIKKSITKEDKEEN